jgi:parallel beta-helix repeat protein
VTVEKGVTLTVEAGTVVKLERGLELNGELKINGTSENPVVFTSPHDDLHGGDTNEDGSKTGPTAGDWFGIYFNGTASGYLHHAEVLYGGFAYAALPEVRIYCPCSNPPEVSNSTFAHSASGAVEVIHGDPTIKGNTIDDNAAGGIIVSSASPEISENDISGNSAGIYFRVDGESHGDVDINDNVIEDNEGDGINVSATVPSEHIDSASMGGNELRGNGGKAIKYEAYYSPIPSNISTNILSENAENGIWLAGKVEEDQTWAPSGYSFVAFASFIISEGATLTLEPGTVVKSEASIEVYGALESEGTVEDPVTFTSYRDDSVDGDTNGDGSLSAPNRGDWYELLIAPGEGEPSTKLEHTNVIYGGNIYSPSHPMVTILCPCSNPPEVSNSTFAHSASGAVEVIHGDPTIKGNTIDDNAAGGIIVSSASPEISENDISGNSAGIYFRVDGESHGDVDINDNVIEDNEGDGINVSATVPSEHIDSASMGGNELRGNGGKAIKYEAYYSPIPSNISTNILSENAENGIWLAGKVEEDQTWGPSGGFAFVVFDNFVIEEGATLTLEPGIVVKGKTSIEVYGAIESEGTVEDPVTFTSYRDDSVGGDTNGDGAETEPTLGDWGGFYYPDAYAVFLNHLDIRYASTAFNIGYLDSIVVAESDFVYNKKAFEVASTAENDPVLGALPCIPPYLSFVYAKNDWFGKFGLPAPDIDISGAIGATLPGEYAPLFGAAATLAELDFSLYGTDNTIPYAIYSCPAAGIPAIPFTPVIVEETPFEPYYPDPEV